MENHNKQIFVSENPAEKLKISKTWSINGYIFLGNR